jgi:hypothetical protein
MKSHILYPDKLNSIMCGSRRAGKSPLECIARKCFDKAFLPIEYTRAKIRACSVLRYQMTRTDEGKEVCQDQVQCLREMQMGKDSLLVPGNGEGHEFGFMALEEVANALRKGEFRNDCSVMWMAFLVRRGHLNAKNGTNLVEIEAREHRRRMLFGS